MAFAQSRCSEACCASLSESAAGVGLSGPGVGKGAGGGDVRIFPAFAGFDPTIARFRDRLTGFGIARLRAENARSYTAVPSTRSLSMMGLGEGRCSCVPHR